MQNHVARTCLSRPKPGRQFVNVDAGLGTVTFPESLPANYSCFSLVAPGDTITVGLLISQTGQRWVRHLAGLWVRCRSIASAILAK